MAIQSKGAMAKGKPSTPKSPSFKGRCAASEASSRAMRGNRARNTRPEILLRKALDSLDLTYRTHDASLPGCPDFVFARARLAVFCDGDFWHGRHWPRLREQLARRANPDYWIAKIATNRARDRRHRRALRAAGWMVFRVWETDVSKSAEALVERILRAARSRNEAVASIPPRRVRPSVAPRLDSGLGFR
jgi:DNA mismatch endonuclease (patch repair protein)